MIDRRELLQLSLFAGTGLPSLARGGEALSAQARGIFLAILNGFLASAARTSPSLAVCEFPDATITRNFLAKSGLSVTAVTRMLPAMAAWIRSGLEPQSFLVGGEQRSLLDIVTGIFRYGFDPAHPDYWGAPPSTRSDQRQVESSIVAWSLWLLRAELLPRLTLEERKRVSDWLAACGVVPVRQNNWAWFTAVNHAVRLSLHAEYPEFAGDEQFLLADLQAMDALAEGEEGWYTDGRPNLSFDFYNSWVFASHYLYWNAVAGSRYPEWAAKFGARLTRYLEHAPGFFGSNGSHVLYGRSLIYRWAILTPLVLAYGQKKWPHSPGLLNRIVSANLEYLWSLGAFDRQRGKLRETLSQEGTPGIRETYIDGGHPYWGMQAFALFLIPPGDPLWHSSEPLPVEKADFAHALHGPGILVRGAKDSGQVRLYPAPSGNRPPHYRDKYAKLSYSSHFPFCITHDEAVCPWDNTLVIRHDGAVRPAAAVSERSISASRTEMQWSFLLAGNKIPVRTVLLVDGELEGRLHVIRLSAGIDGLELLEGSSALGLPEDAAAKETRLENGLVLVHRGNGSMVASWRLSGWAELAAISNFGNPLTAASNVIHPRFRLNTLRANLKSGVNAFASVHYASPKPFSLRLLESRAAAMRERLNQEPRS